MTDVQFNPMQMGFTGNPEADAMRYAQSRGISLEDAKAELKSKFGDPQQPQQQMQPLPLVKVNTTSQSTSPQDKMLLQYGIPADIIAQGDNAIRKYAQDNNINLPAKQEPTNLSYTSSTSNYTYAPVNEDERSQAPITRKQAKEWMKRFSEINKCSRREARQAFIDTFGYAPPRRFAGLG